LHPPARFFQNDPVAPDWIGNSRRVTTPSKKIFRVEKPSDEPKPRAADPASPDAAPLDRYVPLACWLLVIVTLLFIALKIVGTGYLPGGDARRHVAQAFTDRPFTDIVVMRSSYQMDHNPGWDWLLRQLHERAGFSKDQLMSFSLAGLMLCFFLAPLPWMRRPEAWLAALLAQLVAIPELMTRLTQARPLLLTEALCMVVLISWCRPGPANPSWRKVFFTTAAIALSTWMHGTWYMWVLPVAAFYLAGWWPAAFSLTCCWLGGALGGALLTGRPVVFLKQAILLIHSIYHEHPPQWMLVGELQPHYGEFATLILLAIVFLCRRQQGRAQATLLCPPLLWMIAICWILGFKADRNWSDWGIPAVLVWLALQFEQLMTSGWAANSPKCFVAAAMLALPLFLDATNDLDRRYSRSADEVFLRADDPSLAGWLPQSNGIFYSSTMAFFYSTFYENPDAGWRYIVGYEPALMPDDDLKIYRSIQASGGAIPAYEPWADKLRPGDRLVIYSVSRPDLPKLEWHNGPGAIWIGRLPVK
jgi:hypothetical protein